MQKRLWMSSLPPTGCLAGIKHPGKRHLAPRANFHHNASSLFFCKLLVQKSEEISLVLFFFFFLWAQGLGRLKFRKLSWRLPSVWTVLPGRTPANNLQASPRSFKEQGNRALPFSARSGLRQQQAAANSEADSGMQITMLGTVHKVLSKIYRPLRDRRQFGERKFLTRCCILLYVFLFFSIFFSVPTPSTVITGVNPS